MPWEGPKEVLWSFFKSGVWWSFFLIVLILVALSGSQRFLKDVVVVFHSGLIV